MAISKVYKIINPESMRTLVNNNEPADGSYGIYGNYSWFNKIIQGSSQRIMRYREYDAMDADVDVSRALDIIAEEMVGNNPKSEMPLQLKIVTGAEQDVSSRTVVTLKAALRTWCNIHKWSMRLYPTLRTVIKYGDAFYFRNRNKNKKFIYVHPKNVMSAVVSQDDITDVKAWQIKNDFKQVNNLSNMAFGIAGTTTNSAEDIDLFKAEDIVRFTLNNDMSGEAPFGESILRDIYTVFKQKEMLESSILIYRITRAPEKRMFRIEMGNIHPQQRAMHLEQIKNEIKQRRIPTPSGGYDQVESIYSPISQNEDFFFSMNKGEGSTVETLPGGQGLGELKELDYFYNKMWRGLRIPQSYMDNSTEGGSVFNDGKVGIAYQQEIKFTLYIERLQRQIEETLDSEFKKFLRDQNINFDPTVFRIVLPEPSNFKKSRDQEINQQSLNLLSSALGIESMSARVAYSKYGNWSKEEVLLNERSKAEELGLDPNGGKANYAKIYSPAAADSGGLDGGLTGGGGDLGTDVGPSAEGVELPGEGDGSGTEGLPIEGGEEAGEKGSSPEPGNMNSPPASGGNNQK